MTSSWIVAQKSEAPTGHINVSLRTPHDPNADPALPGINGYITITMLAADAAPFEPGKAVEMSLVLAPHVA